MLAKMFNREQTLYAEKKKGIAKHHLTHVAKLSNFVGPETEKLGVV